MPFAKVTRVCPGKILSWLTQSSPPEECGKQAISLPAASLQTAVAANPVTVCLISSHSPCACVFYCDKAGLKKKQPGPSTDLSPTLIQHFYLGAAVQARALDEVQVSLKPDQVWGTVLTVKCGRPVRQTVGCHECVLEVSSHSAWCHKNLLSSLIL